MRKRRRGARPLTGLAPGARSAQNNHEGGKDEQELCHARCAALFAEVRARACQVDVWRMRGRMFHTAEAAGTALRLVESGGPGAAIQQH